MRRVYRSLLILPFLIWLPDAADATGSREQLVPAGDHEITWDGTNDAGEDVATGIYLYVIRSEKLNASASSCTWTDAVACPPERSAPRRLRGAVAVREERRAREAQRARRPLAEPHPYC